jgi:hypothetical protein
MKSVAAFALGLVALMVTHDAIAKDVRFALVIGHNSSDDPDLPELRYADDDALRYYELLSTLSERTELLATLDDETQALAGDRRTKAPTRAMVLETMARLQDDMDAVLARGDRPILYFFYSGHGNYDAEGRGYIHLADGRFTTRDLFHRVLEPTKAHPVVLLIDACNAALLVNSRGASGSKPQRRAATESTYRLENYPNIGVILASSTIAETHEWGRYLAGIFSHEVRSALVGAADLDDDQRVTFAELAAFVVGANAKVTNPNVRIQPYIRPPLSDPNMAVTELDAASNRVRIDRRVTGKTHLVDGDLVRYADFNVTFEARDGFWLVLTRPTEFVVVHDNAEWIIPANATGDIRMDGLATRPRTVLSARGAGSAYFDRTLFHEPFGKESAERYLTDEYTNGLRIEHVLRQPWYNNVQAWTVLGSGLVVGAAGLGMHLHAQTLSDEANDPATFANARADLNADIDTFQTTAGVLYGIGGAAVLTSVFLFALDRPTTVETWDPPIRVDVTGTGVKLRGTW